MYLYLTSMYSGSCIGVARKWSLRSGQANLAPISESEIVLFKMSLVSSRDAAGDQASASYDNLLLPTVNLVLHFSDFRGRMSQMKLPYVTAFPIGTSDLCIK